MADVENVIKDMNQESSLESSSDVHNMYVGTYTALEQRNS